MATVNEQVKDLLLEHSISIQRLEATNKREVSKSIKALEKEIVALLTGSTIWHTTNKNLINKRLDELFKESGTLTQETYNNISTEQVALLASLTLLVEKQAVSDINKSLGTEYVKPKLSKQKVKDISNTLIEGAASSEWWSRRSGAFQNRFKDVVRDGLSQNKTSTQIARDLAGTAKLRHKDGAFVGNYRSAELLVRTSTHAVANAARVAMYEVNNDIIKAIEWVSTLDSRTTVICQTLDGLTWDINTKKPIGHNKAYPGNSAHWGCRSAQAPVLKKYDSSMGGDLSSKTRASMDGQVSAKLNYESWLKTKSKKFQLDVLGQKRHKLWKDGKIDFRDLTNMNNRPLTLEQIQ